MNYLIPEDTWQWIYKTILTKSNIHVKDEASLRLFFEAVWWILTTGAQWRRLPSHYGHWRSVHQRFFRWTKNGIWDWLFDQVVGDGEPDKEWVSIDSSTVRAHPCAAGYEKDSQNKEALGRSAGGFTTKIHALVDALGNPLKFIITPGQASDVKQADELLADIEDTITLADKGYDSDELIERLKKRDAVR